MSAGTANHVRKLIADALCVPFEEARADANLVCDLKADSLDMVEIPMIIEEDLNIYIADDEAAAAQTVGDLIDLAQRKLEAKAL